MMKTSIYVVYWQYEDRVEVIKAFTDKDLADTYCHEQNVEDYDLDTSACYYVGRTLLEGNLNASKKNNV